MALYFVAGIYLFVRGVFAISGRTLFYSKRALEQVEQGKLPAYLKEIGVCHMAAGVLFAGKAALDIAFPGSRPVLVGFLALLLICVVFLIRTNEKYTKK